MRREQDRVTQRAAEQLPEERSSEDPKVQAAAVLADSDARAAAREGEAQGDDEGVERRRSGEATAP